MIRGQLLSTCRCLRVPSTYYSALATTSKDVKPKKGKNDDWKLTLIKQLDVDFKRRKKKQTLDSVKRSAFAHIMKCAVKGDVQATIDAADQFSKPTKFANDDVINDELVTMCLLVVQKQLTDILKEVNGENSDKALSLFLNLSKMWHRIRRLEGNKCAVTILLWNTIRRWEESRMEDGRSEVVHRQLEEMRRHLLMSIRSLRMEDVSIFLNEEDKRTIEEEWTRIHRLIRKGGEYRSEQLHGYDTDLELVDPLREPCEPSEYRGNPFQLDGVTKEDYLAKFDAQIDLENSMWLKVPNSMAEKKKSPENYAEYLIEKWRWRENIAKSLAEMDSKRCNQIVGACLDSIERPKLVEALLSSAMAVCSQGQPLVSTSLFHYDIAESVNGELVKLFKSKLGFYESSVWKEVFNDYSTYFVDPEVSRTHTHREWWDKVCKRANLAPDFHFPTGKMEKKTRAELANVFSEVLAKSCLFPAQKGKKEEWMRAFSYRSVSVEEESRVSSTGRLSLSKMLSIDSKLCSIFQKYPFQYILFSTQFLPMTIPPRPWIDRGVGGPQYTKRSEIVRNMFEFKAVNVNEETSSRIKTQQQTRPVFDALNQLGSTPWVINDRMLEVLKEVFHRSGDVDSKQLLDKLGVPMKSETFTIPTFAETFGAGKTREDVDKEKWAEYVLAKVDAVKARNESNSMWCWMQYRVVLADQFRGQVLFFPHNMDFRGRVYPISPYLSHMGDDVNRCMLKLAKGQKLGPDGLNWLKLHCINLTGQLKRSSVADRMAEAERLLPTIRDSAQNPLTGEGWWMESEEPWQTLAACIEIDSALSFPGDPAEFVSHLPVHQDGSCNGLQHYAALGRDKEGGTQVNLTSSELPNDVYSDVAQRVEQKRLEDEEGGDDQEVAQRLRKALPQGVPRKVIKQTVMTTVYGVTMYGAVQQIKRQLKALGVDSDDAAVFSQYLARKTFSSLNDAFTSSMMLKDWFRHCAKGTSELMQTVEWVTPLGLPVVQPYCKNVEKKGKLIRQPMASKQVDAFPPNYVHSLDSTHMMLTSLHCTRKGITFAAVHDCFWTHANSVDEMNRLCRDQFVRLHSQPLVQQCSEWFKTTYLTDSVRKTLPEKELKKYEDIFTPKIRQGELDIEEVKKSVYFFS